jgi:predicted RNase H-like HicB family nuclease
MLDKVRAMILRDCDRELEACRAHPLIAAKYIDFHPNGERKIYEEEFLQEVLHAGIPLQVRFVTEQSLTTKAEQYFRDRRYLTFHLSYDQEEGWFLYVEQLSGVLTYADTISDALYVLQDALNGFVEAVLEGGQNSSENGNMAYPDRVLGQDEL